MLGKYRFLFCVYLIALVSYSIANFIGANVQTFYRIPGVGVKWIDVAIIFVILDFLLGVVYRTNRATNTNFIVLLCFLYLLFETIQFYNTLGFHDIQSQISHYLCTLSFFIIIDLSTFQIPRQKVIVFLRKFALFGSIILLLTNIYLLYSFAIGNVVFNDFEDLRVSLEVVGDKETVYSTVLTPFVYAYGLYFLQNKLAVGWKIIIIAAIISIFIALVITFYRGTFITLVIITIYFVFTSNKSSVLLKRALYIFTIVAGCYFLFGSLLTSKGYDPINKIIEVAKFTADTDNPEWDKGRSISQAYALNAWEKKPWIGYGYDELLHHGLPEDIATAHNGVITSLFHRGILGTSLLMIILLLLYRYGIKLWYVLKLDNTHDGNMMKLLILVSFFWIIPFMTQEALWEKYSFSIQMLYFGLIVNYYKQMPSKNNN